MARGRFISSSISTSRKFQRLATNEHRLLYLMLIPHVDCEGRHAADARILAGQVYTLLDIDRAQIEAAMHDLHSVGLIRLYEVNGEPFLEIVDFHHHNKVRRDKNGDPSHEAPSRIPPSSDGNVIEPTTEQLRSSDVPATAEGLRVKGKESSVKRKGKEPSSASPTRERYQPFADAWNQHCGLLPRCEALSSKRRRGIQWLIDDFGGDALDRFTKAVQNVASDKYWIEKGYNIDNLLVRDRVLEKSEKQDASHGMTDNDRRLATRAQQIARAIGGLDA